MWVKDTVGNVIKGLPARHKERLKSTPMEPIVECEKGHTFPAKHIYYYSYRDKETGILIKQTHRLCPVCMIEFFDQNISGIKD